MHPYLLHLQKKVKCLDRKKGRKLIQSKTINPFLENLFFLKKKYDQHTLADLYSSFNTYRS